MSDFRRLNMADENWIDKLKPDFKVTRKLYHFPNRGTG